jgi:acyl-CoA thioesterase
MPMAESLGIRLDQLGPDEAVCRVRIDDLHLNQGLMTHGGLLFTLADTAIGALANPTSSEGWVGSTFTLRLFRAPSFGDDVVATARVDHRGRTVQFCTATITRCPDGRVFGSLEAQLQLTRPHQPDLVSPGEVHFTTTAATGPLGRALREAYRQETGTEVDSDAGRLVVARVDGQPRGYAVEGGVSREVWVHPRWRGVGLEDALTRRVRPGPATEP